MAELGWMDEIVVDGRLTTVDEIVRRRMGQFAMATSRAFPQAVFAARLVHEFDYGEGVQGRIECWTEADAEAELADVMDRAGFGSVRSFRRLTVTGTGFGASALQSWPAHVPHAGRGAERSGDDSAAAAAAAAGHPPFTEAAEAQGDLRRLLGFLRVAWFRPVRLARPPYRARRFFQSYSATGTAIEIEDGFALGRKLGLWEQESHIEDDCEEETLRPVSAFIDFREAMSGDLLIEPREYGGIRHSTLIFEFGAEADAFVRRFTGREFGRRRRFPFLR